VAMVPGLGAVDEVHAAVMRALERFL
jgi:hypothetical protein